jgi:UDP:flavonoid glycosyltransferase YjiC (YdhE family)
VTRSGAGIIVGRHLFGRGSMRAALRSLLQDPGFGDAADAMAQGMSKLGGAHFAAELVDEALRAGRTPPAPA